MKNDAPSPNQPPGGNGQPITIRIKLVIQERPESSGPSPADPRAHRPPFAAPAPVAGTANTPVRPPFNPSTAPVPESPAPAKNPSPPAHEGPLNHSRLAALVREDMANANPKAKPEPDIEITLVLYL